MIILNGTWSSYTDKPVIFMFIAVTSILIEIGFIFSIYEFLKKKFGNIGIIITILSANMITFLIGYLIYYGV
ncbi:MAG TPA: hypothetical protein VGB37_09725 [Candidatus Lokiarchaeia archaeon]